MHQLSMDEMKAVELELLKTFDAFCKTHGLRYWLSDGTLIGAMRHKGFIPWDDDVDIQMPKQDYYELVRLVNEGAVIGEHCRLGSPLVKNGTPFHCPFAKLYDTRTTLRQKNLADHLDVDEGVWMDIFPLTGVPDDEGEREALYDWLSENWLRIWLCSYRFNLDCGWKRRIKRLLLYIPARLHGLQYYLDEFERKIASLPSIDETENAIAPAYFTYHLKSGMFTAGTFDTPFEDGIFPAPLEYDWYLTATYGDWRTPPAPEDRGSTHHFEVYWR